jgi:hypothetical protein
VPSRYRLNDPSELEIRPTALIVATPTQIQVSEVEVAPRSMGQPTVVQEMPQSQLQRTTAALIEFAANPPAGGTPDAATDALKFVDLLPGYFPAPKAVQSEDGIITLFWKTEKIYADIEFHGDRTFSVFTRSKGEKKGDDGLDSVPLSDSAGAWLFQYLGELLPSSVLPAAA